MGDIGRYELLIEALETDKADWGTTYRLEIGEEACNLCELVTGNRYDLILQGTIAPRFGLWHLLEYSEVRVF